MGRRQQGSGETPEVRPLDVDGVRTVAIITVLWGVAFVLLALRQGALNDAGRGWWLWTCLAGVGLGLLGLEYCRKRRDALALAALEAEAAAPDSEDDWSGIGDWSQMPDEPDDAGFGYDAAESHESGAPPAQSVDDQHTQPYSPAGRPPPGYVTGEFPSVPPTTGEHPRPPRHAGGQQPATPPPAVAPPPAAAPPVPPTHPAAPLRDELPARSTAPAESDRGTPVDQDAPDSTGSLHAAPAGYAPDRDLDRTRRHPRDQEVANRQRSRPAAQPYEPLADEQASPERPAPGPPAPDQPGYGDRVAPPPTDHGGPGRGRYGIEDSEFFADEPTASSTTEDPEFLLFDLDDDPDGSETGDDAGATGTDGDRYRGRRARRNP